MDRNNKSLIDENREGFIQNESGNSIKTDRVESDEARKDVSAEDGSKSDPQLTELDGLKKGGVEPHVHPNDKPREPKRED
jgi:hypothetical protein